MHKSSRNLILLILAGVGTAFSASPAYANDPWNITDHSSQGMPASPTPWGVTNSSAQGIPHTVQNNPTHTPKQNHNSVPTVSHKRHRTSTGHTHISSVTQHRSHVWNVKSGDTLSGIAHTYGKSVNDIASFNGIEDPDLIFVGQTIIIP